MVKGKEKIPITYRGHRIRRSGLNWLRIYDSNGRAVGFRVKSVKAAKILIDSRVERRVMTPAEHRFVYIKDLESSEKIPQISKKLPRITPRTPRIRR